MTLIFLKLGGSLITDKNNPHTPRLDVITRLAEEIAGVVHSAPETQLLIGHGSGSFGHVAAARYHTLQGVKTVGDWLGFTEVWREAHALNTIVMDALGKAGLPAISFPPSAEVTTDERVVVSWNLETIRAALDRKIVPVVYGDVIFDRSLGGTILSTEDLFRFLAYQLHPARILLAGIEAGVWSDYPQRQNLLSRVQPEDLDHLNGTLNGSEAVDVTGGMLDKVRQMLSIVRGDPNVQILIFSGLLPGTTGAALRGETPGTILGDFG
jgi:isopentenyl phosphate kinase